MGRMYVLNWPAVMDGVEKEAPQELAHGRFW
jgi:hypothetical protein